MTWVEEFAAAVGVGREAIAQGARLDERTKQLERTLNAILGDLRTMIEVCRANQTELGIARERTELLERHLDEFRSEISTLRVEVAEMRRMESDVEIRLRQQLEISALRSVTSQIGTLKTSEESSSAANSLVRSAQKDDIGSDGVLG